MRHLAQPGVEFLYQAGFAQSRLTDNHDQLPVALAPAPSAARRPSRTGDTLAVANHGSAVRRPADRANVAKLPELFCGGPDFFPPHIISKN
jgi:hypothetical protein